MEATTFFRQCLLVAIIMTSLAVTPTSAQGTASIPAFEVIDADRDGRITHAEFYRGLSLTGLFEYWDANRDGKLNRQEVHNGLQKLQSVEQTTLENDAVYARLGGAAYQDIFRSADLNRNGNINKAEFYTLLFRKCDSNRNGSLMRDEFSGSKLPHWFVVQR